MKVHIISEQDEAEALVLLEQIESIQLRSLQVIAEGDPDAIPDTLRAEDIHFAMASSPDIEGRCSGEAYWNHYDPFVEYP